jgi:hypothetical protein
MHRIGGRRRNLDFGLGGVTLGIPLLNYDYSNLHPYKMRDSVRWAVCLGLSHPKEYRRRPKVTSVWLEIILRVQRHMVG